MREIWFVADDFGLDAAVNEAILRSHLEGSLDGAALMLGQPGTEGAVAMARDHPSLRVGWHLHLSDSRPLTTGRWPWGASPARAGLALGVDRESRALAEREIEAQWRVYETTGLPCDFVNCHHHLHVHPWVRRRLLATLPGDFDAWLRWGRPHFFRRGFTAAAYELMYRTLERPFAASLPLRPSTTLWGIDRTFCMEAAEVVGVLPQLGEGLHEFIFHPRQWSRDDPDTRCLVELKARRESPG